METATNALGPSFGDQSGIGSGSGAGEDVSQQVDHGLSIGKRIEALRQMLSQVGDKLIRLHQDDPLPPSLPCLNPNGELNVMALASEFETMILALRSQLLTYSSWLSSPDPHTKSSLKLLVGNMTSHARWNRRKESTIKSLAEIQLTAMAHTESLLASKPSQPTSSSSSTGKSLTEPIVGQGERMPGMEPTLQPSSSLYEHDVETRRGNLINRFDFIARSTLGNSVYTQIIAPEPSPEDLFIADPDIGSGSGTLGENDGNQGGDGNQTGHGVGGVILTDPKAILQLTLASTCSLTDIQIDARGKYSQVSYEYDKVCRYVSRWIMEALERGKFNIVEQVISKAYNERCKLHFELSESLKRQHAEATKAKMAIASAEETGKEKKVILRIGGSKVNVATSGSNSSSSSTTTSANSSLPAASGGMISSTGAGAGLPSSASGSAPSSTPSKSQTVAAAMAKYTRQWATPETAPGPEVDNIHARLLSAERDLVVLARVESLKYGLESLKRGMGWMTMAPAGPVVTSFVNPILFASSLECLSANHSTSCPSDSTLASISKDHLEDVESLPSMDAASLLDQVESLSSLPSFNSNVIAPVVIASLSPSLSWCSHRLGALDTPSANTSLNSSASPSNPIQTVSFRIQIEQNMVYDPNYNPSHHGGTPGHEEKPLDGNSLHPHFPAPQQHRQQHIHSHSNLRKRVGAAPRSASSAILSTPDPEFFQSAQASQPNSSSSNPFLGVSTAITNKSDFIAGLKSLVTRPQSTTSSFFAHIQEPASFCDLGIQWNSFEHADSPEDIHLPLSLVMVLSTEMPILFSLFHRLRSLAAHPDPAALLNEYYQMDEAHREGKEPPVNTHTAPTSSGPKKLVLRAAKALSAATSSSASHASQQHIPHFVGASLASLYAGKHELSEEQGPSIEDVVMPLLALSSSSNAAAVVVGGSAMVRCLHSHQTKVSPASLMVKSVPFVDARQIRSLVAILRQQAVITNLYDSCFNPTISTPIATYLATAQAGSSSLASTLGHGEQGAASHGLRHSSSSTPLKSSTNSMTAKMMMMGANFDIASPPRRAKRPRQEELVQGGGLRSPPSKDNSAATTTSAAAADGIHALNKSSSFIETSGGGLLSREAELMAKCQLTIELTSLKDPLFGWLVMVKHCRNPTPDNANNGIASADGVASSSGGPSASKKPKNDAEAPSASSSDPVLNSSSLPPSSTTIIFSFAVHVSVDGFIHVQPEDCELVLSETRSINRLKNLIETTLSLPVALQLWLKDL